MMGGSTAIRSALIAHLALFEGVVAAARIESGRHDTEDKDDNELCDICAALAALDGGGK